jgi:putative membrane protein
MKLVVYLVLFIVIVVFGLTFALKNPQSVEIHYYPDLVFSLPLAVALFVALLLGVATGLLAALFPLVRRQRELARLKKQNQKLDEELQNLRTLPIKDAS